MKSQPNGRAVCVTMTGDSDHGDQEGHAGVVQKLLEAKADANIPEKVGMFDVRDGGRVARLWVTSCALCCLSGGSVDHFAAGRTWLSFVFFFVVYSVCYIDESLCVHVCALCALYAPACHYGY